MYREYHIATHTNADGFITGAIVGYYYKEIKSMMIKSLMCSKVIKAFAKWINNHSDISVFSSYLLPDDSHGNIVVN